MSTAPKPTHDGGEKQPRYGAGDGAGSDSIQRPITSNARGSTRWVAKGGIWRGPRWPTRNFYEQERPLWWGNLCDQCAKLADLDATRQGTAKNGTEG